MRYLIVTSAFLSVMVLSNISAASQIGVAAGIRGQVIRASSPSSSAAIGQMSSGQTVFIGDEIKVGQQSRLQVMLLDETVFTLGANASMTIDEFVYDPSTPQTNALSASIKRGSFRFVSGRVTANNSEAMKVITPSATIGVRGTSAGGEVQEDGSTTVILLGPGQNNSFGLSSGSINVTNDMGSVDITRPGFVTEVQATTQQVPPSEPAQATQTQIQNLEQSLSEQAAIEIAKELDVDVDELQLQQGTDTNNDGELDSFAANQVLSDKISAETENGGTTQNRALLAATALTLFGEELLNMDGEEAEEFFSGVNLGSAVSDIFNNGAEYLGPTSIADIRNAGLTGTTTFFANNVIMNGDCGAENCGSYNVRNVWDFTNETVTSTMTGSFSIDNGLGVTPGDTTNLITGTLNMQSEQLSWSNALESTFVQYKQSIPADNLLQFISVETTGRVGAPVLDETTGAPLNDTAINSFVTIDSGTIANDTRLEVFSTTSLSNVQFNGAGGNVANFSDHSIDISIFPENLQDGSPNPANETTVRGFVFGLETE